MDFTPMMSADGHEEASLQWKIPNLKRVMASQQKNPMRFVRSIYFSVFIQCVKIRSKFENVSSKFSF